MAPSITLPVCQTKPSELDLIAITLVVCQSDFAITNLIMIAQVSNSQAFVDFCQRWTSPPAQSPETSNPLSLALRQTPQLEDKIQSAAVVKTDNASSAMGCVDSTPNQVWSLNV